jgi:hypothetical protein
MNDHSTSISELNTAKEGIEAWKNHCELMIAASAQLMHEYYVGTVEIMWGSILEQVLGYSLDEMGGGVAQWEKMIYPEDRIRSSGC